MPRDHHEHPALASQGAAPDFPNKDALVSALHARHDEQMMKVMQRALTKAMDATLTDEHHDEYLGVMEDRIVALLARHRDEITAPDLKLAAFMLMHAAPGLIHAAVLKRPKGVSLKHATQEIVSMTTAYLTRPRPA